MPEGSSTGDAVDPQPPATNTTTSPPTSGPVGSSSDSSSGSSGDEVIDENGIILWTYEPAGQIDAVVADDDDSVWMLVVADDIVVEHVSPQGELLEVLDAWDGPMLSADAAERRRDMGQLVLMGGVPAYALSWSLHDAEGEYIESVSRIEVLGARGWSIEDSRSHIRLDATQTLLVGTDVDETGLVSRFMIDIGGAEVWRYAELPPNAPQNIVVEDVAVDEDGGLTVMTRSSMFTYRPDGFPFWGLNFNPDSETDYNTAVEILEDGIIVRMFSLVPMGETEVVGAVSFFEPGGDNVHNALLPQANRAFDVDASGSTYTAHPESALAKFDSSEDLAESDVVWTADLAPTKGREFVDVTPTGAVFYATEEALMRFEP